MAKSNKKLSTVLTAGALAVLWATSSVQVAADVISTDVESLAIYAGRGLWIGRGSSIGGDIAAGRNIAISRNNRTKGVYSEGNVWIARDSTVAGDVLVGSHKRLSTARNVTITGLAAPHDYVFSLPELPDEPDKGHYGAETISRGRDTVTNLAAGAYKNLSLWGSGTTLNLSAGTYTFKKFWMASGGTMNVDTSAGDVVLNVHKSLSTGRDVSFINSGGGNVLINVFDNNVWLGHDSAIQADVRVWDGNFGADKNMEFTGTIWAGGSVNMARDAVMIFPQVPEPGTLMLLACGGGMLALRRRRRKTARQ